jgi:hypothetical protein
MAPITAAAQPTPDETAIAFSAQFIRQAPHSMHASRSTIAALRWMTENTPWGQTSSHRPQPLQRAASRVSEWPFKRYRISDELPGDPQDDARARRDQDRR